MPWWSQGLFAGSQRCELLRFGREDCGWETVTGVGLGVVACACNTFAVPRGTKNFNLGRCWRVMMLVRLTFVGATTGTRLGNGSRSRVGFDGVKRWVFSLWLMVVALSPCDDIVAPCGMVNLNLGRPSSFVGFRRTLGSDGRASCWSTGSSPPLTGTLRLIFLRPPFSVEILGILIRNRVEGAAGDGLGVRACDGATGFCCVVPIELWTVHRAGFLELPLLRMEWNSDLVPHTLGSDARWVAELVV